MTVTAMKVNQSTLINERCWTICYTLQLQAHGNGCIWCK